ncbi:MAG: helix-turn-helix domain-containing protein [Clostridia bacterium]|nr:helix-turn-helix domain-containing protein [Clostridia bacterium]
MDISKNLVAAIELRKTTQKALAEKLGMTPAYLNKLCKGTKNPSMDLLERICQALEMSPCEFFSCLSETPVMHLRKSEILLINNYRGLYEYEQEVVSDMVALLRKKHLCACSGAAALPVHGETAGTEPECSPF